ncbi:MAG: glycyl-radical enzyme activating protein [Clostridia bacterium]|nr:glycyl-radical enzyme activating protein [Clostridia bacterium]
MTGIVFDIKEFSVHDGPGVRTTVFMKGCPLSCKWCHNPEGLSPTPEIMVRTARCRHCGLCKAHCSHVDCKPYERCLHACPDGLVSVVGKVWDSDELAKKLLENADFMETSGGGVTVSGGEPTMQADFVCELFDRLSGVHRAVETCGFCGSDKFLRILDRVELVMMDVKLADPALHKKWCGVSNEPILANLERLKKSGKPHIIRVPLIPNITDTRENLFAISELIGDSPVELLPYNPFAGAKYEGVGKIYTLDGGENAHVDLTIFKNAKLKA